MLQPEQLAWIQRNLRRERPPGVLGALAQEVMDSSRVRGPTWRRKLASTVWDALDEEARRHLDVRDVRNGTVTLEVDEPGLLYQMRITWEQQLLWTLRRQLPAAGIRSVRFTLRRRS